MNFFNMFFENGWTFVMFLFFNMGLIGIAGGAYMKNRDYTKASIAGVCFVMLAFSYTFYQVTTSVITDQVIADAVPASTQPMAVQEQPAEMVYTYGANKPITMADHERQLAYSAATSPGDPE